MKALIFTFLLLIVFSVTAVAQLPIQETVGTATGTIPIATNVFDNTDLSFSGTGDTRSTGVSSGYSGASGGRNVFITNAVNTSFIMHGLDLTAYSNITLSFGAFKSTTASNMTELVVSYSTNGLAGPFTNLTFPAQPTGSGTANWRNVSINEIIPSNTTTIRWINTSASPQFRLDDFVFSGALPVTLLTFSTKADKNNQNLSWTYESPERFDYFEVEHSRDGKTFNALDRISEGEFTSRAYKANYTHIRPGAGIHYYRLKMVDLDGSFAYSQVIQGKIDGSGSVRPLSTFISTEGLNVSVETSVSSLELRLVDQLGRTIFHSTQAAEAGIMNIPVSNLGSGVYFLQVNADGVMETHKLIW